MKNQILFIAACLIIGSNLFATNVKVTNTNASGSGSLSEAINQANSNPSIDSLIFNIPISDANYDSQRGVFVIEVTANDLPEIKNEGLVIDGFSQTNFTGNTNPSMLGYSGKVGVDQIQLNSIEGPEIEIFNGSKFNTGLKVNANNITIQGISIFGFGYNHTDWHANIYLFPNTKNATIQYCALGIPADSYIEPPVKTNGYNIGSHGADSALIQYNAIGHAGNHGIFTDNAGGNGSVGWLIQYNDVSYNAKPKSNLDGIGMERKSSYNTIQFNYISNNGGNGVDYYYGIGKNLATNNTVINNGKDENETGGFRVWGEENVISKNIISSNYGSGVLVTSSSSKNTITQNSIFDNGSILSTKGTNPSLGIGIDLINSNEKVKTGTTPFFTLNDLDDNDLGGNDILNYPVIQEAYIQSGNLNIKGWARPNSLIEFFTAAGYPNATQYQGKSYLFSLAEGSSDDLSTNESSYGPGPVNGNDVGEDNTNYFHFSIPTPNNVSAGDTFTTTATLNQSTSEFSPFVVIEQVNSKISPVLECVYENGDGTYSAVFGYYNPNASTVTIPISNQNEFVPSPQDRGQTKSFLPGRKWAVYEVNFSGSNLVWKLNGKTATASANSKRCYFDLEVVKTANNSFVKTGDTVEFTIEARNKKFKPMTNVKVLDALSNNFQYLSYVASSGSFNPVTGIWDVPQINNGDTAKLKIKVIVNNSGDNFAVFTSADQQDGNDLNNYSQATVTDTTCSNGNDGGVESNGNLANKLATRHFQRNSNNYDFYGNFKTLQPFEAFNSNRANSSLNKFIPFVGPDNAPAVVSTPADLLNISNAEEVLSVDYLKGKSNLGAILATRTPQGEVYDHTKIICDRLTGAELKQLEYVTINDKVFIISKIRQADGSTDYAISFVIAKSINGDYSIDCRWNNADYNVSSADSIFNLQVWTIAYDQTVQMVQKILNNLDNQALVSYKNTFPPVIPNVFVKKGFYENGVLQLELQNDAEATEVYLNGNYATTENGDRVDFGELLPVENINGKQIVKFELGFVFDAGFSLENDIIGGRDVLYFADGPWGTNYSELNATQNSFEVFEHNDGYYTQNEFAAERSVKVTGLVNTEFTVFKSFKVGNQPVNLSNFNQIVFEVKNRREQDLVVKLNSNSIDNFNDQFEYLIPTTDTWETIEIGFDQFVSSNTNLSFSAEDLTSISFDVLGDKIQDKLFELEIRNVKFNSDYQAPVGFDGNLTNSINMSVYPNPANDFINVVIPEITNSYYQLIDIAGKVVKQGILNQSVSQINTTDIAKGSYTLKVSDKDSNAAFRVIIE